MRMKAPEIDFFLNYSKQDPLIKDPACVEKLMGIFDLMFELEEKGDDEFRTLWIEADRGSIDDFGRFEDYREEEVVETENEFNDLWLYYYPDQKKWYSLSVTKYAGQLYFNFDMELTFSTSGEANTGREISLDLEFLNWLYEEVDEIISRLRKDHYGYNACVAKNLPYQKRFGRILRKDYWTIFPDEKEDFETNLSQKTIGILEKVAVNSSAEKSSLEFQKLTAGDFFRYCELGYDANAYFNNSNTILSPKDKYLNMADGRDCGLRNIDEDAESAFKQWYETERHCGGHPWEICRGGNSTHISLFVEKTQSGWLLRLAGSSRGRVIETVKMAVALYVAKVPFYLQQSDEIFRMVTGQDYIGIVPETILPRYCHSHFPTADQIIDFMHLGTENKDDIIKKAFWYPEKIIRLKSTVS